jgi:hypothetical protein
MCSYSRWQDIACRKFARTSLEKFDNGDEFPRKIFDFDEAALHISVMVHRWNIHIWRLEHSHAAVYTWETAAELMCGVARCRVIWLDPSSVQKQLWHPLVTLLCWETCDSFPVGIHKRLSAQLWWSTSKIWGTELKLLLHQLVCRHAAAGAWVSFGHCMHTNGVCAEGV